MEKRDQALRRAVKLVHVPTLIHRLRIDALPSGVDLLLEIAAGDQPSEQQAMVLIDRDRDTVRDAVIFFIQQVLFAPDADHYRVLGTTSQASREELRRNMTLLLRWLHPDVDRVGEQAVFLGRVMEAWNSLKTPEGRAAYDRDLRAIRNKTSSSTKNTLATITPPNSQMKKSHPKRTSRSQRKSRLKSIYFYPKRILERTVSLILSGRRS